MNPKAPEAQCDSCPLKDAPFVPGKHWGPTAGSEGEFAALVGEAPGPEEARKGEPFVGQSGRLLKATLAQVGAAEEPLWITNTVLCYPTDPTGHFRAPEALEIVCCRQRLAAELRCHSINRVVALGSVPTRVFSPGEATITKRHGHVLKQGLVLLIPCYHPAYVLRQYNAFPEFRHDLELAMRPNLQPDPKVPGTKVYRYGLANREVALSVLRNLATSTNLVLDIETTGYDAALDAILLLALSNGPKHACVFDAELFYEFEEARVALQKLLDTPNLKLIGHSAKFDLRFLRQQWGVEGHLTFDTLLAHYALDERTGTHSLKQLAAQYYQAPDYEANIFKYLARKSDSFAGVPREELAKYSAYDADYTMRLYHTLEAELAHDPGRRTLFEDTLMPLQQVLSECEAHGVAIDQRHCRHIQKEWSAELESLRGALGRLTDDADFNPNSPMQVANELYTKRGYPVQYAKTGKVTTNEEALVKLHDLRPDQLMEALLNHRKLSKLKRTYIDALLELSHRDGRIHTDFLVHGTITGRLSSHRPNLLNIPRSNEPEGKAVKDAFVASPGHVLLQGDYRSAELRVLAYYSGDETLREIFRKPGSDIHSEVARMMFGDNFTKEDRIAAKMVVFGLAYGRTAYSLSLQLKCSVEQAQSFVDVFFRRMPKCREWQQETVKEAFSKGYLETIFHRRRRFGLITYDSAKEWRNQAINFRIQSTAADITSAALIRLAKPIRQLGGHLLLSVHDSILVEVPKAMKGRGLSLLEEIMVDAGMMALGSSVRWEVDLSYGHRWGSLKETRK
jgi:DNA polymerase-1